MTSEDSNDTRYIMWSEQNTIENWLLKEAERLEESKATAPSHGGSLSLDKNRVLKWSWTDQKLYLFHSQSGALKTSLAGHQAGIKGAILVGGNRIVSWSWDDTLHIWGRNTGNVTAVCEHFEVEGACSLDNRRFASWSYWDFGIRVWDSQTGIMEHQLLGHKDRIQEVTALADGRIFSRSVDGECNTWG